MPLLPTGGRGRGISKEEKEREEEEEESESDLTVRKHPAADGCQKAQEEEEGTMRNPNLKRIERSTTSGRAPREAK